MREIWDTRSLQSDVLDDSGRPRPDRLETMMEPEDLNALEMALKLRDVHKTAVTAISLGNPIKVDVLREALYRGADAAVRLRVDGELDALARARLLAAAVKQRGGFDLILTGLSLPEGENSQVGSHCASLLGIPQVTYVEEIEAVDKVGLVVRRAIEGGTESVRVKLPCLLTVGVALLKDDPRTPRPARAKLKLQHAKSAIPAIGAPELGISPEELRPVVEKRGLDPLPPRQIQTTRLDGGDEDGLKQMIEQLKQDRVL
jgi:electron transfer flavoprotein beta subunit